LPASSISISATGGFECSPPLRKNGAKISKAPILSTDEQKMYTKHSNEVKQMTALVIIRNGLCIAELPPMTQILQEDYFFKNFEEGYNQLCEDVIIGKRMKGIPLKFLNISTSKSDELMSGVNLRKKYSTFKTYINNTLTLLWKK
jgi:hypothetical protein